MLPHFRSLHRAFMSKCRHLLRALCDRHRHTHSLVQATNKELELRQGRLVEARRVVEEAMQQTEALLGRQVGGLAAVLAGRLCVPPSKWVRLEEQLQAGTRTPCMLPPKITPWLSVHT